MKPILTSGKRKRAIARATTRPGSGIVKINNLILDYYEPKMYRLKLKEPLIIAGDAANKVDISVNVIGGGIASQADASRLAIAKGLVEFSKNDKLKGKNQKRRRGVERGSAGAKGNSCGYLIVTHKKTSKQ